jgi:hypothetical protein
VLFQIASRPDGVLLGPAVLSLSKDLNTPASECNALIMEMTAGGYLTVRDDERTGERFLLADFDVLGLAADVRSRIVEASTPLSILGPPHSPAVVERLQQDFDNRRDTVYLAVDIAAPEEFSTLNQRVARGWKTVILLPSKHHLPMNQQRQYEDARREWVRALRDSRPMKRTVTVRVMRAAHPELFGSVLTSDEGRLRLRSSGAELLRVGSVVSVGAGTAVYALLVSGYVDQLQHSDPLRRVWPVAWARSRMPLGWVLAAMALVVAVILAGTAGAIATVLAAFLVNLASDRLPRLGLPKHMQPDNLFD